MKELHDIILAYDQALRQNKRTALVTVVQVEGSSYRRPGARMLVTEEGEITGAISGGCLEGDALRKAQSAMRQQQNKLEIYDTRDDDDDRIGVQLGCNGVVYILFEPIQNNDANNPVNLLKRVAFNRKDAVVATVFNTDKHAAQTGTCLFLNDEEYLVLTDAMLHAGASNVLRDKRSMVQSLGELSVLYQFVPPVLQLLIVGAGNDAMPLVDMAFLLGWKTTVADGRPAYATQRRFPKAQKVCTVKPEGLLSEISIDQRTAVVLMTHNYNYDLAALEQLINTHCRYIGVLGPKKKLHKMFDALAEQGVAISDEVLKTIYGPVGLDIGSETSEEIALSMVAEIKAVFSNRRGTPLKEKPVAIHEPAYRQQHD
ncbi:MAG: XdhC family protein [Saprospiraceae bacterium]|nr:XdhC family protein [Saprospiraceae bacterium]